MRTLKIVIALCAALAVAPLPGAYADTPAPALSAMPSFAQVVTRTLPAVVNIAVDRKSEPGKIWEGAGFIIDPTGEIVTNNHVVEDAAGVKVTMKDGTTYEAKVLGRDKETDLALLKIYAPKPLPFVSWGDSDAAQVGDWVVAIGNPFGLASTVTAGIISALDRSIKSSSFNTFIQIDAPINRGNSGGPTFDLAGEVIGVNTSIYSPSGGSVGVGFDIPSNVAKRVIGELRQSGRVARGVLGVSVQSITSAIAKVFGLSSNEGALVSKVTPDSPAAAAGVVQGDVIIRVDGHPVQSPLGLMRLVSAMRPGQTVALTVVRDGREESVMATLGDREAQITHIPAPPAKHEAKKVAIPNIGLAVSPLDPIARFIFDIPESVQGVVVSGVKHGGFASTHGLKEGDVIESVGRRPVQAFDEGVADLERQAATGILVLLISRGNSEQFVSLTIPASG